MHRALTIETRTALLREAIALMEQEYGTDLQLDDVAHRIATSRRQLQRCFVEHGDGTYRTCLTRIRLARAADLLVETDLPIQVIARRVGYRQPAQFAKAFNRRYGMPPTSFRAAHATEAPLALAA